MPWAFAQQFRPHVALRGRLCAVGDILVRGVCLARLLSAFLSFFIGCNSKYHPHISQGSKKKKKKNLFSVWRLV
jgi:hypothetical protein